MNKYLETELGHYLSSFFFMKINTEEELNDFSQLKPGTEATFVHEYIHFLQDISTSYGLMNMTHIIDIILSMTKNIFISGENSFKVPVVLTDETQVGKVMDIISVVEGDQDFKLQIESISSIDLIKEDLIQDIDLYHIQLNCLTKGKNVCHLLFGSLCMIESMAYHIENILFQNVKPPQFPYKICDLIINFKYPILLDNELNIIAICDLCLNSYNPGKFFIEALDHMKERKFIPKEPSEIYDFLLQYGYPKEDGNIITINDLYIQAHLKWIQQIEFLLYDPIFKPIKDWTIELINKMKEKRGKDFSFLLSILTQDKTKRRSSFFDLVNEIGVPLMANSDDSFCFTSNSIDVFNQMPIYRAISELFNILADRQRDCKLTKLCEPTGIVNPDCASQPWNWSIKEKKCTFGAAWTLYGLQGKTPVFDK